MLGVGVLAQPPFHLEILAEIENYVSVLFDIMCVGTRLLGLKAVKTTMTR